MKTTTTLSMRKPILNPWKKTGTKIVFFLSFLAVCMAPSNFLRADFTRQITLNVNGHPHPLPDLFTEELNQIYDQEKANLETEYSNYDLELPNTVTYFGFREENNEVRVVAALKGIKAKKGSTKFTLAYTAWAKLEMVVEGVGLVLRTYDSGNLLSVTDADVAWYWDLISLGLADDIVEFFVNVFTSVMSLWADPLQNFEYKVLDIEAFNASSQDSIVEGVNPELEAQAVLNSLPIDVSIDAINENLVININLIHGYYNSAGQFVNIYENVTPSISPNPNLLWGGFGYSGDKFQFTQHWDTTLTYEQRVDATFQSMQAMGLTHVRIEAIWKDIVPTIDNIDPALNPDNIDGPLVEAYIEQIQNNDGWETIGYVIQSAVNHNIVPYVIVGLGHRDRPPKYDDGSGPRTIAPGTVRGNSVQNFIGIPQNVYLYWLKLYSRAVVNKFSQLPWGVAIWQAENELNAARFAETYDWWRKGDAWADDAPGGFVETVAVTLKDAIRIEDPTAQIIQDFHIFNLARALYEWRDYYDIAGINVYPNDIYAMPVMGFMVGEIVWAAKRALQAISDVQGDPTIAERPVWVIETAYPAIEPAGSTVPQSYNDNITFYSQERQKEFLEESLNSCAAYGADMFSWFLLTSPDDGTEWLNYSSKNSYSGLFDASGNPKLSYQAYIDAFQNASNGELVTFANKYLTEDLNGSLTLQGVYNGLKSGQAFRLPITEQFTIWTDNEWLEHTNETDTVKHHDWNLIPSKYLLTNNFDIAIDGNQQNAQFDDTYPIHFQNNIPERQGLPLDIDIKDPWYVNAQGNQINQFHSLGLVNDTINSYSVFLDQDSTLGMKYYTLRVAKRIYVGTNDMWIFDRWVAIPETGAYFPDGNTLLTAPVVFKEPGIVIEAYYESVSDLSDYTLTVGSGETLTIPSGAIISFGQGFLLNLEGNMNVHATAEEPVTFQAVPGGTWKGIRILPSCYWNPSHVILRDAEVGIGMNATEPPSVYGCTFDGCTVGLDIAHDSVG